MQNQKEGLATSYKRASEVGKGVDDRPGVARGDRPDAINAGACLRSRGVGETGGRGKSRSFRSIAVFLNVLGLLD